MTALDLRLKYKFHFAKQFHHARLPASPRNIRPNRPGGRAKQKSPRRYPFGDNRQRAARYRSSSRGLRRKSQTSGTRWNPAD